MAVLVHTRLCGSTILLRLYHWRTSDLNATGRCRPTIRSRSSLRSKLQRVDMAAALGNGSAPRPCPIQMEGVGSGPSPLQPVKGRPKLTHASTRVRRYPTEQQIMDVRTDFIVGAYSSVFAEVRSTGKTGDSSEGVFSNATVGPCDGEDSDFFPAGSGNKTLYSTCRPQLHAAGIGTWLWEDYCEDPALRPVGGATEETVCNSPPLEPRHPPTCADPVLACLPTLTPANPYSNPVRRGGDAAWAHLQRAPGRQRAQRRYPQRLCGRKGGAPEGRDAFAQSGNPYSPHAPM